MTDQPETGLPSEGRLAGVDFGTVRIGIAVSDPGRSIASPFANYTRRTQALDAEFFKLFVSDEHIVGFVVGLPVHLSGDESEKTIEAKEFGNWLHRITGLPVIWFDERFTTSMAREFLSQSHLSGKKRKAQLDKMAAQILLTAYLESNTNRES